MSGSQDQENFVFNRITDKLSHIDPVAFCEKYLTLDGKPYRLSKSGYRPHTEILRYIAIKALEKSSLPIVILKSRQIGMTVLSTAAEMYFMGSGLFGSNDTPPIRIIHAFPQLDLAFSYAKVKLNGMISGSIMDNTGTVLKGQKPKSYMQSLLDTDSPTNDSLQFKQFKGGNHIFIESTGLEGGRFRGKSSDIIFFDECFPYDQYIETIDGKQKIGKLVNDFLTGKGTPLIKTFNEKTEQFEFKKMNGAWNRGKSSLIQITCGNKEIRCTPNHRFLSENGWLCADQLVPGTLLKTSIGTNLSIRALNEDQLQLVLGSFLGDGHLASHKMGRYRLSVVHSIAQSEYCEWKASLFNLNMTTIAKNGYASKPACKFVSKAFGLPGSLPKIKTSCPQWVLDKIDARGIAIWFMDDGSIDKWNNGAAGRISTCSFDEDSQIRFVNKFKSLGIDCHYSSYEGYYYLMFNKDGFSALCDYIRPYIHNNLAYKITDYKNSDYQWNNCFKPYGLAIVDKTAQSSAEEVVYDIGIEDNHNFILAPSRTSKNSGGPIAHNCQDMTPASLGNATKVLNRSQYGAQGSGVQVYFGTPKQRGGPFWDMWNSSTQQHFHLGCEKCKEYFPLYTPGTNDWEDIWIYGFTVRCTHCGCEQDKFEAAERGKWIAAKDPAEAKYIGFFINQLFMPDVSKEKLIAEKPGISAVNTERAYQNEVLGEFFHGEATIISPDQIREICGDPERKFRANATPTEDMPIFLGIDIGAKGDLEQLVDSDKAARQGQSYSTAVVLAITGVSRMEIIFATKFKRNDLTSKKGIIDQIMRTYGCNLAVCDIGYAQDLNEILQTEYGGKFLSSQASGKVNGHIKYNDEIFPKVISFERDFWIAQFYEQMKKGNVRFPLGDYEKISWLISHCSSMEIKPSISRSGDITPHYVKGSSQNDGFMALLNAYIAYRFYVSNGFKNNNGGSTGNAPKSKPLIVSGYVPKMK